MLFSAMVPNLWSSLVKPRAGSFRGFSLVVTLSMKLNLNGMSPTDLSLVLTVSSASASSSSTWFYRYHLRVERGLRTNAQLRKAELPGVAGSVDAAVSSVDGLGDGPLLHSVVLVTVTAHESSINLQAGLYSN